MMHKTFLDCYADFGEESVVIGNGYIERAFSLHGDALISRHILNKATGFCWRADPAAELDEVSDGVLLETKFAAFENDHNGLSARHLVLEITFECTGKMRVYALSVYPGLPFVQISSKLRGVAGDDVQVDNQLTVSGVEHADQKARSGATAFSLDDTVDVLPLSKRHLKITAVKLYDKTDRNDTLVSEETRLLYPNGTYETNGNLFFINNYLSDECLMAVKDSPTHLSALGSRGASACVHGTRFLEILGTGAAPGDAYQDFVQLYGSIVGVGKRSELPEAYKDYYRACCLGDIGRSLFIMSNTWGDRSQDSVVGHDFIMSELQAASNLGIDVLQIDDGWQKGVTANSKLKKGGVWEGYYAADPDFWQVNETKFPHGLEPLAVEAQRLGIKLALWFSPDSSNEFSNWQRDADTLLHLHARYGASQFKLDGVNIQTKRAEANFARFLDSVCRQSSNAIGLNLDITAQDRLGYLYLNRYGTLFVENRYTDWANYYPHNTLKNAWSLSHYFPLRKFQFEVLNNERNAHLYGDDPLAPARYTIDYTFACVMCANPLLWMEMMHLPKAAADRLAGIINVYKQHREKLFEARVFPIGDIPDGCSFTGFQAVCDEQSGYLILFRESTQHDRYTFRLNGTHGKTVTTQLLYTNVQESIQMQSAQEGDAMIVHMDAQRTYGFFKYHLG